MTLGLPVVLYDITGEQILFGFEKLLADGGSNGPAELSVISEVIANNICPRLGGDFFFKEVVRELVGQGVDPALDVYFDGDQIEPFIAADGVDEFLREGETSDRSPFLAGSADGGDKVVNNQTGVDVKVQAYLSCEAFKRDVGFEEIPGELLADLFGRIDVLFEEDRDEDLGKLSSLSHLLRGPFGFVEYVSPVHDGEI